jgi:hypothetical protein
MICGSAKMVRAAAVANDTLSGQTYEPLEEDFTSVSGSRPFLYVLPALHQQTTVTVSPSHRVSSERSQEHPWGEPSGYWDYHGYETVTWSGRRYFWLDAVAEALGELGRLPENWDSYGARRISGKAAATAIRLLIDNGFQGSPPHVVPTPPGGVQLEWQDDHGGVEIEIDPTGHLSILLDTLDNFDERQTDSVHDPLISEALARVQHR